MSTTLLIDEDMPRSTGKVLKAAGFTVIDVRDVGLRGSPDRDILAFACDKKATIITADIGFGSLVYFSDIEHFGIIILRLPVETQVKKINETLLNALSRIPPGEIAGSIIVIDRKKIRIRLKNKRLIKKWENI